MSPALRQRLRKWLFPLTAGGLDVGRRIIQGAHVRALLLRASQSGPLVRVLNAGAGEGGYSPVLLKLPGVESVLESDIAFLSLKPERIDPRQIFLCSSLVSIPASGQIFDLVLCTEVLEHIREDDQALDEIARVIAPGGRLLITVPMPPAPFDPAHVREGYRRQELESMLTERGFDIVETRFCMHFFFRFLYRALPRVRRCPRILVGLMAYMDRLLPIGPPMDLMILAQLGSQTDTRRSAREPMALETER